MFEKIKNILKKANIEIEFNEIEHDWELAFVTHDEQTHEEYKMLRCKACGKYKKEYTDNIYGSHKCEFCDSLETTKYPSENTGHVWLCEDCHSRSSD